MASLAVMVGECTGKMADKLERLGWGRCWIARDRRIYVYQGEPWILDNGAFRDWKRGDAFNHQLYQKVIETKARPAAELQPPRFCVAPDIPGGGIDSLEMSVEAADPHTGYLPIDWPRYLAVQDGMTAADVAPFLCYHDAGLREPFRMFDGLFLGGTNEFKLTAAEWRQLATTHNAGFHYGRCGTLKKLAHAIEVGADSIDSAFPMWSHERFDTFTAAVQAAA